MSRAQANAMGVLVYTVIVAAITFLITDHLNQRERVAQVYAPEVRTAPNDVALETKPGGKPEQPAPTAARGGKLQSTTEIYIGARTPVLRVNPQPPAADLPGDSPARVADVHQPVERKCYQAEDFACPPIDVRLDLRQLDDGQQYMAVRGSDGTEITGQYLPRVAVAVVRKNKAGIDLYADDTKVIRYQRRVFHRFWLGPSAMIEPTGSTIPGATIEGEW